MLVVSYADFFANPKQYQEYASVSGIKILPDKKRKKLSHRIQKKIDALNAVVGIIPSSVDVDALLAERRLSK